MNIADNKKLDNTIRITTPMPFQAASSESTPEPKTEKKLRYPKCNSENIEPIPVTTGKIKGYSLLTGVIGMGKGKTKTEIMWVCKACGKQFAKPEKS